MASGARYKASGLGLIMLSLARAASAQPSQAASPSVMEDVDLLELLNVEVSTATKTSESLEDAPAIITVVTAEDIARWGYDSVGEVLQHVLGFYLIDDHIVPNAAVRGVTGGLGAESGVIKVMIDGASAAYRSTSGNWLGVELIPLSSIYQIEIIRGPASALYGADAFLGVVNIITVPPEHIPALDARGQVGTTGSNLGGRFDVASGARFGNFDVLVAAAGEQRDRSGLSLPDESPAPTLPSYVAEDLVARNLERRSLVLQTRLGYRVPRTGHLVLSAIGSGIERGGDFAHWAQLTGGTDGAGREVGTVVNLGQFRGTANGALELSDNFQLSLTTTYFQGGVLGDDRIEVASDLFWVRRHMGYRGGEGNLEARWMPSDAFNVIYGVETVVDDETKPRAQRISKDTGEEIGTPGVDQSVTLANIGAYVSSNYKLFDPWLKLTGGLRYDHHSIYGPQVTGRLGATSRWSDAIVTKLLYGSAFKAPSPYLLYAVPLRPGDVIGNALLEPQRIDTFELQLSYKPGAMWNASTGLAYSIVRDKAEFTPEGINLTAKNIASQKALSWETQVEARLEERVQGYASFEYTLSQRDLGEEGYAARLVGSDAVIYPPWIARAGVSADVPLHPEFPLQASAQGVYVAARRAGEASIVENGAPFSLPSYFWLNASLAAPKLILIPGHESTIALRGKNLLGAGGPDPGSSGFEYALRPRELLLDLRHVF